MVEGFTNFQRRMWYWLCYTGVFIYYVDITDEGRYKIRKHYIGKWLYWVMWVNDIFKFVYHILTYNRLTGIEVHFLDQMSVIDWLLMFFHAVFEGLIWSFKYPIWENLYRQWELQEEIYRKLGKPQRAAEKITHTDRLNFVFYYGVCTIGTLALVVQFYQTPKYALNTYALLSADTWLLRIIFCFHECCFMFHVYIYQAFTMVVAESYACSYQHILEEMNKALRDIISVTKQQLKEEMKLTQKQENENDVATVKGALQKNGPGNPVKIVITTTEPPKKAAVTIPKNSTVTNIIAKGTTYNLAELLADYKKITISGQFHNQWIGKIMGAPEGINYMQFVADVFMMIQLLKEDDVDLLGVFFYIADCIVGMIMLFRMLILLARLYPQSVDFIDGLKEYSCLKTPQRKELRTTIRSLRIVAAKLSGYTMRPESVPIGINVLINYYICAAMWQRPTDPSRRT